MGDAMGASCRYESNSSGTGPGAWYNAYSQLTNSRISFPASRIPQPASPTSHSSTYAGWARDIPNRESLRAGKVKSGSALRVGASSAAWTRRARRCSA